MKKLFFSSMLLFVFFGCQKDKIGHKDDSLKITKIEKVYSVDVARSLFAKSMAISISEEPKLKSFLIKEAKKKYNGDYDILYAMIKDEKIGSETIADILQRNSKAIILRDGDTSGILDGYFSNGILNDDPYLTVYIPKIHFHNPELFDLPTTIAIVGTTTDEKTTVYLEGYDENGIPQQIDAKNYPVDQSIFVIKTNERIAIINSSTKRTINDNDLVNTMFKGVSFRDDPCNDFYLELDGLRDRIIIGGQVYLIATYDRLHEIYKRLCSGYPDFPDGNPGGDDPDDPDGADDCECPRDCRTGKDEIYRIKFNSYTSFKEVCSWWDGDIEIYVKILWGATDQAGVYSGKEMQKSCSDEREDYFDDCNWFNAGCEDPIWVIKEWETFTWNARTSHTMNKMFSWWEEDEKDVSGEVTVGTTLSFDTDTLKILKKPLKVKFPFSIKLKYNPADDHMGDSMAEYCDGIDSPGEQYNTGTLKFNYRRRE